MSQFSPVLSDSSFPSALLQAQINAAAAAAALSEANAAVSKSQAASSAADAEAASTAAAASATEAAEAVAAIPDSATITSAHASTNDAGDLTITPTSRNHTEVVAVTGEARTSALVLDTTGRADGDRLTVVLDLTDAVSDILLNPTSGSTAVLPADNFPGQVFRTNGLALPFAATFGFRGTAWEFIGASNLPTEVKLGGLVIPTNFLGSGTAIDFDFRANSKTVAADGTTLTVAGAPTTGAWTRVEIVNSDEADHTVGIPSSSTLNSTAAITSVTVKAGGRLVLSFEKTSGGYNVYGDPPGAVDLTADVTGVLPSANGGVPQALSATDAPAFLNISETVASPAFASTINLDFATEAIADIAVTGDITLTTSNLAAGRKKQVRLSSDSSVHTITVPGWKVFGAALPTSTTASKVTRISLECMGTTDAEVDAVGISEA